MHWMPFSRAMVSIREEVSDRAGVAQTLNNIGLVYHNLGQREQALDYYQRTLPIREEVGDRYGESVTRYNIAKIHRAQGCLTEAVIELRRAVTLAEQVSSPHQDSFRKELTECEAELAEAEQEGE